MKVLLAIWRSLWPAAARPQPVLTTRLSTSMGAPVDPEPAVQPPQRGMSPEALALSAALRRRPEQRHQLRSLIALESMLRFAPQAGIEAMGENVLRRALAALQTFEELPGEPQLMRLQRLLQRRLKANQAHTGPTQSPVAGLGRPRKDSSSISPAMAYALAALKEGDSKVWFVEDSSNQNWLAPMDRASAARRDPRRCSSLQLAAVSTHNQRVLARVLANAAVRRAARSHLPSPSASVMAALWDAIQQKQDDVAVLAMAGKTDSEPYRLARRQLERWTEAWRSNR